MYADTVLRLARELKVSPGWLLSGDGLKRGVWVQVESGREDAAALAVKRLEEVQEPPTNEVLPADKKRK